MQQTKQSYNASATDGNRIAPALTAAAAEQSTAQRARRIFAQSSAYLAVNQQCAVLVQVHVFP